MNSSHLLGSFGRSAGLFYTLSYCAYLRVSSAVSGQGLTDQPFLCSPGVPQVGNRDASRRTCFFPRSSKAAREGACEFSLWKRLSPTFSDVFLLLDHMLSCDHRDAGYYLLLPTACEIMMFLAEALIKEVSISKDSGVTKSLIML